jgi:hypothetical protein
MDAERLHLVLKATHDALAKSNVLADFAALASSLQNQVNDPATPSYQQQVSTQLEKLRVNLSSMATNNFPPGWKQVLTNIQASHFIGTELLQFIEEIFLRNAITPSIALKDIQEEQRHLTTENTALVETLSGFKVFGVPLDDLKPGDAEIGLLVPRESIDGGKLERFTKELADISKIIGVSESLRAGWSP